MEDIGYKLKRVRELKSYSQEYVADRLHVSPSTISRIENHVKSVRLELILNYCNVLDVQFEDMLSNDESKNPNSQNIGSENENTIMYSMIFNIKDKEALIAMRDTLLHIKV